MENPEPFDNLLLERDILRVTLAVRNHFLSSVVADIYENTGQLLSAIRVQLALIEKKVAPQILHQVQHTGKMVSQSIVNLRSMSRDFYPEEVLLSADGFVRAVNSVVNGGHHTKSSTEVSVSGTPHDLQFPAVIFLFNAVLKVSALLRAENCSLSAVNIAFTNNTVEVQLQYAGKPLHLETVVFPALVIIKEGVASKKAGDHIRSVCLSISGN